MTDKKDKSFNRRDFLTAGVSAMVGAGLYGVSQNNEEAEKMHLQDRTPAGEVDQRNLATDPKKMKGHYPVLIIGSGYGGSVLAARLAASGKNVCILERGKEWHPGMFPTNSAHMTRAGRTKINPMGLVDSNIHSKSDVDIICASGLGGTSLLNAAIASRPEDLVFQQKEWPKTIREAYSQGKISRYMDKAQSVLKATRHPEAMNLRKTQLHKRMVDEKKVPFNELLLNVNQKDGVNEHGVNQGACTLCGDCCAGCNVGAKNVLTANYIPMARAYGAEIFSHIEVIYVIKEKTGQYTVHYVHHLPFPRISKKGVVTTDQLIMAAGSMGSTQIMLRSKMKGLRLSKALGTRFSANGDVMGFSYNGTGQTDILGQAESLRPEGLPGQSIMVYGDYRLPYTNPKSVDLMNRYLLLDGTIPGALGPMVAKAFAAYALANPKKFTDEQMRKARMDLFDTHEPEAGGALNNSMIFFACGHDTSGGVYKLDDFDDRVHVKWKNVVSEKGFQTINREMASYAKIHGGVYIPNPRMTIFGQRMMATHPLGGCPMGEDAQSGVVDHLGRVFDEDGSIHKNFFVVDASIIPRSLGATPLLTISALAERIADHIKSTPS